MTQLQENLWKKLSPTEYANLKRQILSGEPTEVSTALQLIQERFVVRPRERRATGRESSAEYGRRYREKMKALEE